MPNALLESDETQESIKAGFFNMPVRRVKKAGRQGKPATAELLTEKRKGSRGEEPLRSNHGTLKDAPTWEGGGGGGKICKAKFPGDKEETEPSPNTCSSI